MDYLDFVVEHSPKKAKDHKLNLFEKVMLASKRARDLSLDKTPTDDGLNNHKYTSAALYEILHNKIKTVAHVPKIADIDEEEEEEDESDSEDAGSWKTAK